MATLCDYVFFISVGSQKYLQIKLQISFLLSGGKTTLHLFIYFDPRVVIISVIKAENPTISKRNYGDSNQQPENSSKYI